MSGLSLADVGAPAEAAPGPNPNVTLTIAQVFDGTGHGTPAASFVNSANGFAPGDDTATDGVVSSGDDVGYEVELRIAAGPARTVALQMNTDPMLGWESSKADFCAPARGVAAEVSGDTCLFSVAAGATAQIRRTLLMTGADTAGEAVRDQRLAIQVGLRGEAPHATVRSQPVTVVSAPSADLVIRPANPRSAHRWSDAASGAFQILALPVTRPGFAPLKGAASGGAWTARVDVSAFPAGTEWEFKGTHPTPDAEGWLALGPITGNGDLAFTIPGGWPAQAEGETTRYDVHLDVPSSAFASEDYLNNGSGWQPGTGSTKGHSTFDSAVGSTAGIPYPNNDYSAVSVYRELSLPPRPNPDPQQPALPSVFGKSVAYPNDPAQTAFEPGNMNWAAAPETGYSNPDRMTARAVGSQLRTELLVLTQHLSAPVAITVGDEWDPGQQSADGPLTVLRPDGSALDPASYAVEWSTSATGTAIADAAVTAGWVRQPVAIPGARAVRVLFAAGALPTAAEAGAGAHTVQIPMRIRPSLPQAADPVVRDTMRARAGDEAVLSAGGAVLAIFPTAPVLHIDHSAATSSSPARPGDTIVYRAKPSVSEPISLAAGFDATVTITMDRCTADPVTDNPVWTMTVTPAVAGESGRVCGDPTSTPAVLRFTPTSGPMPYGAWDPRTRTAALSEISYTARATRLAGGNAVSSARFELGGSGAEVLPVSDDAPILIDRYASAASVVHVDPAHVEIDERLRWRVELDSDVGTGSSATIIALPRTDDGGYLNSLDDPAAYRAAGGAEHSAFHGTVALQRAALSADDTTPGTRLFFTTRPHPSLDPTDTAAVWHPVSQAGQGSTPPLAEATALRVEVPAAAHGASAILEVTMQPRNNREDDRYLLWAGRTAWSADDSSTAPMPWPREVDVVMGSIAGTVWWDENRDAARQGAEHRVEQVEVGLFRASDGAAATPMRTVSTNADGEYRFDGLPHGDYVARILDRGSQLPRSVTSYYNQQLDVEATYSFRNQRFEAAKETSTPLKLTVGGAVTKVDFGFFTPGPKIDIDKSSADLECGAEVCTAAWELQVQNLGTTDLDGLTLTDTASDALYDVQLAFGGFSRPVQVVETQEGGIALLDDGTVWSWGSGTSSANGNGGSGANQYATPVLTAPNTPLTGVTRLAAKARGGLALREDGTVWAWGYGGEGQNGDGATSDNGFAAPVLTAPGTPLAGVASLHAGDWNSAATLSDGSLWTWGSGNQGGSANGTTQHNLFAAPVLTAAGTAFTNAISVSLRDGGGAAVRADGTVWAWGSGMAGATGNGLAGGASLYAAPVKINSTTSLTSAVSVSTRMYGGAAILRNGTVVTWGERTSGATGTGPTTGSQYYASPLLTGPGLPLGDVESVSLHPAGGAALRSDGSLWSWGLGLLTGNGTGANNGYAAPVLRAPGVPLDDVAEVRMSSNGGRAVLADRTLVSWGAGLSGSNANGGTQNQFYASPVLTALQQQLAGVEYLGSAQDGALVKNRDFGSTVIAGGKVFAWGSKGKNGTGQSTSDVLFATAVSKAQGIPLRGSPADGSEAIVAQSQTSGGGLTERSYALARLPKGETLRVLVTGSINRGASDVRLLNQAWVTSPDTPFVGLQGRAKPLAPADPGPAFTPAGIVGNPSCDTDASSPAQNTATPDSCDQVAVTVPGAGTPPGSISGSVWVDDLSRDGVREPSSPAVAGVPLSLVNSAGALLGQTVTGEDGSYRFVNVPAGHGYTVEFGVRGQTPTQQTLDALALPGEPSDYSYGFTSGAASCAEDRSCAGAADSRSAAVSVSAGQQTRHVNAGVVLAAASLQVTKAAADPALGNPAQLSADASGDSAAVPLRLTFTNTGSEPLVDFHWVDTTLAGPAATGLVCSSLGVPVDPATLTLPVAATVECEASLPSMHLGERHRDRFTVLATGADTGTLVSGEAAWEAVVGATPSWTLSKTADPANGSTVAAGDRITYTLTATNTGNLTLDDLRVDDEIGKLLGHAKLDGQLPVGVTRSGSGSQSVLQWQLPPLAPGGSLSVSYTVTVNSDAHGATLVNRVSGSATVQDPAAPQGPRRALDPSSCTAAAPCATSHRVAILPIVIPIPPGVIPDVPVGAVPGLPPRLTPTGSDSLLLLGAAGIVMLATGLGVLSRRRRAAGRSAPAS